MMKIKWLLILMVISTSSFAADNEYLLTIKDHRFDPEILKVPSAKKIKLLIKNMDNSPEEFESHELNREKIIPAGKQAVVYVGPLKPGTYSYFGEFNQDSAKGQIIAE